MCKQSRSPLNLIRMSSNSFCKDPFDRVQRHVRVSFLKMQNDYSIDRMLAVCLETALIKFNLYLQVDSSKKHAASLSQMQ